MSSHICKLLVTFSKCYITGYPLGPQVAEQIIHYAGNFTSEKRRDGIPDLHVLLCPIALENIVIREGLQPSCLPHRQAPALGCVRVDEVVAILGNMARDSGGGIIGELDAEAIIEYAAVPVAMFGTELQGKIRGFGTIATHSSKNSSK